ncbi:MAG: hypothetical protein RL251_1315 [Pseudomonadota bacterium]|jgi:hypothetical protein
MPFAHRFRNEKGQAHNFAKAMRTDIIWTFSFLGLFGAAESIKPRRFHNFYAVHDIV